MPKLAEKAKPKYEPVVTEQAGGLPLNLGETSVPALYHYTGLLHLAEILREGLWRGEIARSDDPTQQAISLTAQTNPDSLFCWGREPCPEKTSVRFVCAIPGGDDKLEPARKVWDRLRVWKQFKDVLAPFGQVKWWYFYHGLIPLDRLAVQFRGRAGYVDVSAEAMARVVPIVAAEREKYATYTPPDEPWALDVRTKDPAYKDLWLLDDVFAAERFGLGAGGGEVGTGGRSGDGRRGGRPTSSSSPLAGLASAS
jgi:hypothetical protein